MSGLENSRVLITGANSTARYVAESFISEGAKVFASDIREDAVRAFNKANPDARATVANVGVEADVERLVAEARTFLGGIDILVNVVGIGGPTAPTEEISTRDWQQTMDVNVNSVFFTSRAVIPEMKARRSGVIINFSSASTRTRLPNRSPYVTSKFAVEGLTLNLARELGPFDIRANAILPGGIDNERVEKLMQRMAEERGTTAEEVTKEVLQFVSMRTMIHPQEIADAVVFLCSSKARHITGQLFAVDGNQEWED